MTPAHAIPESGLALFCVQVFSPVWPEKIRYRAPRGNLEATGPLLPLSPCIAAAIPMHSGRRDLLYLVGFVFLLTNCGVFSYRHFNGVPCVCRELPRKLSPSRNVLEIANSSSRSSRRRQNCLVYRPCKDISMVAVYTFLQHVLLNVELVYSSGRTFAAKRDASALGCWLCACVCRHTRERDLC